MIWFTEIATSNGPQPIAFQFFLDELPEGVDFGKMTKLNKLEYFGGFKTNQIIGTFQKDVSWSGTFSGTKTMPGNNQVSAKTRSDALESLMGRPLRVGFPVAGMAAGPFPGEGDFPAGLTDADFTGGLKGVYIIEEYVPSIKSYWEIDYTIRLVPHQRQEKIRPTETRQIAVDPSPDVIAQAEARINDRKLPVSRASTARTGRAPGNPRAPNQPRLPQSVPPRDDRPNLSIGQTGLGVNR